LTKHSFNSICGRYSIAKAFRQYGYCCYWGGINFFNYQVKNEIIIDGIEWLFIGMPSSSPVIPRDGGNVVLKNSLIRVNTND
jgi:hypothetical protein